MKIVSHYLQSIEGVAIYPMISLLIFLTVFALITIWALRLKKSDIQKMQNIPFEDTEIKDQDINLLNKLQ